MYVFLKFYLKCFYFSIGVAFPVTELNDFIAFYSSEEDGNHQQRDSTLFSCKPLLPTYCTLESSLKGLP